MSSNEHLIHRFRPNPFQAGLHHLYAVELVFSWFQNYFSEFFNECRKLLVLVRSISFFMLYWLDYMAHIVLYGTIIFANFK